MQEEIDFCIESAEESMNNSIDHLTNELTKIRSGKASPVMLSGVMVEYYGVPTPINQVANIRVADGRTLEIEPWEKSMVQPLERALMAANLGITPQSDGKIIRMIVPPLTEERRHQLIKQASGIVEQTKVGIRSARRDAMEEIKKAVKDGYPEDAGKRAEATIQGLTDKYTAKSDEIFALKEKDLLTV